MNRNSKNYLDRIMNVYIQKPWRVADCSSYRMIREYPPKNVKYANMGDFNLIQNKKSLSINNFLKRFIKKIIKKICPTMPNAHYTPNASKYDLIHCEHCLSKNDFPWIANFEYVGQLWASGEVPKIGGKKKILELVESSYCKKIITWTKWAKDEIVKIFPEIENKIEVVYPGIPFRENKRVPSKDGKIRLLFAARNFYFKGGFYAVEVMDRLTKKYDNIEAIVASDVPDEILDRYSKNGKINFLGMVPQKRLIEEIYPMCDIFVYPSFTDTFGFAIIEAMGFGLPVVSVGGHSRKELIDDGKTGFVIDNPFGDSIGMENLKKLDELIVNDLKNKVEEIYLDEDLRKKIRMKCIDSVNNGRFSIEKRNKRLKEIYLEALKNER